MTLLKFRSGTFKSWERKSKTGLSSDLMSEVRILGHMPMSLGRSFWWMPPFDWRKEMMEWMEGRVAEWRDGFWERALPESTPIISRQRTFSLNWRERFFWVVGV